MIVSGLDVVPLGRWEYAPVGDAGLLLTWRGLRSDAGAAIQQAYQDLSRHHLPGIIELVPGIASLLVCYDPLQTTPDQLRPFIEQALSSTASLDRMSGQVIEIEVAYGSSEGPDLAAVATACGLSPDDVVALHTARPMPVLMLGFMPGFPYIGELPSELRLPRRMEPRIAVPAGSVAIANDQTGIYPSRSPGGWHIIGQTTAQLFDPLRAPPALLRPGDRVRFVPCRQG